MWLRWVLPCCGNTVEVGLREVDGGALPLVLPFEKCNGNSLNPAVAGLSLYVLLLLLLFIYRGSHARTCTRTHM